MPSSEPTCPVCGQTAFDGPPERETERTCRHCGTLLQVSPDKSGEGWIVVPVEQPEPEGSAFTALPAAEKLHDLGDWWHRSGVVLTMAWQGLRAAPSLFWPALGAFLSTAAGVYMAEGIDHPIGLVGLVIGPGLGIWLVTMSASALALALFRRLQNRAKSISFGRALRMLLEHKKALSHRVMVWIAVGTAATAGSVLLVSLITAAALFLPGTKILLGLLLGLEVLAAASLAPIGVVTAAGLAIQPVRACRGGHRPLRDDLLWWKKAGEARTWMGTGVLLAALAAALGLALALLALDGTLQLNTLVIPSDMRQVLSASVLAPLLGIDRAVEPPLGLQLAGAAASAGILAALALFLTPALAVWSAACAAAAWVSETGREAPPKD